MTCYSASRGIMCTTPPGELTENEADAAGVEAEDPAAADD